MFDERSIRAEKLPPATGRADQTAALGSQLTTFRLSSELAREIDAPSAAPHTLLYQFIQRILKATDGTDYLIQEQGMPHLAEAGRILRMFALKYPEQVSLPTSMPAPAEVRKLRVTPNVISVFDYSKSFGHTDLVTCAVRVVRVAFRASAMCPCCTHRQRVGGRQNSRLGASDYFPSPSLEKKA